jgi:hypothetical protein
LFVVGALVYSSDIEATAVAAAAAADDSFDNFFISSIASSATELGGVVGRGGSFNLDSGKSGLFSFGYAIHYHQSFLI